LRQSFNDDTSLNGFNGSFTFFGGSGPELDADNQPIAGTLVQLTALQVYQRTLLGEQLGLTATPPAKRFPQSTSLTLAFFSTTIGA
jgi:hypothetical protein